MTDPTNSTEFSVPLDDLMGYEETAAPTDLNFTYGDVGSGADIAPEETVPHSNVIDQNYNPNTDFKLTPNVLTQSPIELYQLTPKNTETIGNSNIDGKPVLDVQNIDDMLRWKTQLLFDNADEKADFIKQELGKDYLVDIDPISPTNVIVKKKGTRYWGRIDPTINDSTVQEITENIDGIAQALAVPAGILASGLAAGGIEGLRQAAKKYVSPESDFSETSVGIATGAGMLPAGAGKALGLGKKAATDAAGNALEQTGKLSKIGAKVTQAAKFFDSPQYMAQEWRATAKDFGKGIEANFDWLSKNSPEFAALNKSSPTLTGKVEAATALLQKQADTIGRFYEDPNNLVKMVDTFDSPGYLQLKEAARIGEVKKGPATTLIDRTLMRKAEILQRDFLEKHARVILPEKSPYLKAFNEKKLNQLPSIKKMGFKSDNEAMEALLKTRDVTAAEAQMIKDSFSEKIVYGKAKGQIKSIATLQKNMVDAITHSTQKTIESMGDVEMAIANKMFHELSPVVKIGQNGVNQGKTAEFNFTQFVPSALNGVRRQALLIGAKALNRTEVRTGLRNMLGAGADDTFAMANTAPMSKSWAKNGMQFLAKKGLRGASFLEAKAQGKKSFLPRDSSAYFSDPTLINAITEEVQDRELTDTMVRQIDNGNKEGFANTLSMAAAESPDSFDPSPYRSLVKGANGESVIQDKYEREEYRQWVNKNITDPREKFRYLKALNMNNEMLKAPYEIPVKPDLKDNIKLGGGSSAVSRAASALKQSETVELDDGTERQEYDY